MKPWPSTSSFLRFDDYRGNGETVLVVDDLETRGRPPVHTDKLGYVANSAESGERPRVPEGPSRRHRLLDMIMDPA